MAKQIINISAPNDGLGDTLYDGMDKVNQNFAEINTWGLWADNTDSFRFSSSPASLITQGTNSTFLFKDESGGKTTLQVQGNIAVSTAGPGNGYISCLTKSAPGLGDVINYGFLQGYTVDGGTY